MLLEKLETDLGDDLYLRPWSMKECLEIDAYMKANRICPDSTPAEQAAASVKVVLVSIVNSKGEKVYHSEEDIWELPGYAVTKASVEALTWNMVTLTTAKKKPSETIQPDASLSVSGSTGDVLPTS